MRPWLKRIVRPVASVLGLAVALWAADLWMIRRGNDEPELQRLREETRRIQEETKRISGENDELAAEADRLKEEIGRRKRELDDD